MLKPALLLLLITACTPPAVECFRTPSNFQLPLTPARRAADARTCGLRMQDGANGVSLST